MIREQVVTMSTSPSSPEPQRPAPDDPVDEFERSALEAEPSLFREFREFIREQKAWWMVPLLLIFALLAGVAWLSGSGLAPFIYPLF